MRKLLLIFFGIILFSGLVSAGTIEVILNSPPNGTNFFTNSVTFNATGNVTGGATLINATLYDNSTGTWENRKTIVDVSIHYKFNNNLQNDGSESVTENISGTVVYGGGKIDQSYRPDSINYFNIEDTDATDFGTEDFTIGFWVNLTNNTNRKIFYGDTTIYHSTGGTLRVNDGSGILLEYTNTTHYDGNFHHMIWKREGDNNTLWIDGVLRDTDTSQYNITNGEISIGQYSGGLEPVGGLDDLRIYKGRAISDLQILSLYNSGIGTEDGGALGQEGPAQFTNNYSIGTTLWNVEFCDSDGNCNFSISNYTFNVNGIENNVTYNSTTYETARETFVLNTTISPSITLSSATFYYDGELKGTSLKTVSGNNTIFTNTIDIPSGVGSNSFYWSLDLGGEIFNTSTNSQTVSELLLGLCNATLTTQVLNFTLYDESDRTVLEVDENTTSSFEAFFRYWAGGSGETYKEFAYSLLNNETQNNYLFCYQNTTSTFSVNTNLDVVYSAVGYRENTYFLRNATLTQTSSNIPLYLLSEDLATKFFLTFQQGVLKIDSATVTVQKYVTGIGGYITTAILLTDTDGKANVWLDIDKDYRYSIVQDGELLGVVDKKAICSAAPCSATIIIESASADPFEPFYDVYAQNVLSSITLNRTSNILTYSFIDTTGLADYFRFEVERFMINQTEEIICNTTTFSSAGSIDCNLSGLYGEFIAIGYISRSPELIDQIQNFLIEEDVISALGDLGIFIVFSLLIVMIFAGAVVTRGSPSGILSFLAVGILALKLVNLFPYTWAVVISLEVLLSLIIWRLKV